MKRICSEPLRRVVFLAILGAFASSVLTGCGPTVTANPHLKEMKIGALALLPAEYPPDVTRERVNLLRAALEAELRNQGFIVIDDAVVSSICKTPKCPERATLASKYLVDGFATLDIDTASRNSFLAGYYNVVSGKLVITDVKNVELATIEHTQRQKGGLIFNSGQVIQGVISQLKNSGDENFNQLASAFASTVASQLPSPKAGQSSEGSVVQISSVEAKPVGPSVYEICSHATPNSLASFVIYRQHANLREVSPGLYCGIYRVERSPTLEARPEVEVRSAFGTSVRKELPLDVPPLCPIESNVKLAKEGSRNKLVISCVLKNGADCSSASQICPESLFQVYKAPEPSGPYTKVTTISSLSWVDHQGPADENAEYAVLPVTRKGELTAPVPATITK